MALVISHSEGGSAQSFADLIERPDQLAQAGEALCFAGVVLEEIHFAFLAQYADRSQSDQLSGPTGAEILTTLRELRSSSHGRYGSFSSAAWLMTLDLAGALPSGRAIGPGTLDLRVPA